MPRGGDQLGDIQLDLPAERKARGLEQTELAALSGVNRDTIRQIENGTARGKTETRAKLRRALDAVQPVNPPLDASDRAELHRLADQIRTLAAELRAVREDVSRLRASSHTHRAADQSRP